MKYRLFAGVMAFCLILTLFPTVVFATDKGVNSSATKNNSITTNSADSVTEQNKDTVDTDSSEIESQPSPPVAEEDPENDKNNSETQNDNVTTEPSDSVTKPNKDTEDTDSSEMESQPSSPVTDENPEDDTNNIESQNDNVTTEPSDSVTEPNKDTEDTDSSEMESQPSPPVAEENSEDNTNNSETQNDNVNTKPSDSVTEPNKDTEDTDSSEMESQPSPPVAEDNPEDDKNNTQAQNDNVITESTDSVTIRNDKMKDASKPKAVKLPDTDSFDSNEDFKPYDPGYPKKSQYGNYSLQIPDLKDRLTFSIGTQDQLIGTLYAPGVSESFGWEDATKQWNNIDNGLCFAASSSNLISWYLNRYLELNPDDTHDFQTDPERIFDYFRRGWDSAEGGNQTEALSWYFTGGFPSNNPNPNGSELTGDELGGYLLHQLPNNSSERWSLISFDWEPQEDFNVYGSFGDNRFPYIEEVGGVSTGRPFSTMKKFSQHILRQLHYGPCTISIITDNASGGSGHAITLWGVDYDVNTGLVTHIHVTDSDDSSGLFTVEVESGTNNNGVRLVQYPYHPPVGNSTQFTRIRDSIVLYAPDVVQSNNAYNGPNAEIETLTSDSDGTGVTVKVSNINPSSLEYGYSYDTDPNHVIKWQDKSHFSGLKPDQYYFFARVKKTSNHAAGGTSTPSAYRVKTPSPTANESVAALGLGTSLLRPYNGTYQYIWYGTERGEDGTATEEPILWRILDTKTNMNTKNGLFLISDKLYGIGNNGGLIFSEQPPYSNYYENSDARRWCQNFAQENLNSFEQSAILPTTKTDLPYANVFDDSPYILSNDKVFLPSAEEISNGAYGFGTDASRQARYRSDFSAYWLRSPVIRSRIDVGYTDATGTVAQSPASSTYAARPSFNLDSSQVLYTAAVNNGLVTDQLGMVQIKPVQSQDFRLVLKDTTSDFRVTSSTLTAQPDESIALGYESADSGFISAILIDTDNTTPIYYGKIALAQSEAGEISFTIPSNLADGTYTLKVFNEQYNGEKRSGTASPFCDVTLTVKAPIASPIAQVNLTLTAPVTGQAPQNAVSKTEGCIVASTKWTPSDSVFKPNTNYTVSIELKTNVGHTFTKDTVFTLNGKTISPITEGGNYVINNATFPTTEESGSDDSSNGNSDSNSGSGDSSNGDSDNNSGSDDSSNGNSDSNSGDSSNGNSDSNSGDSSNGNSDSNSGSDDSSNGNSDNNSGSDDSSNGNSDNNSGSDDSSNGNSDNNSDSDDNSNGDSDNDYDYDSNSNSKPTPIPNTGSPHSTNNRLDKGESTVGTKPSTVQNEENINQNTIVGNDSSDSKLGEEQAVAGASPSVSTDSPTQSDESVEVSTSTQSTTFKNDAPSSNNSWIPLAILIPVICLILYFILKPKVNTP